MTEKKTTNWNPTGLQCTGIVLAMIFGLPLAMALFIYSLSTAIYFIPAGCVFLWVFISVLTGISNKMAKNCEMTEADTESLPWWNDPNFSNDPGCLYYIQPINTDPPANYEDYFIQDDDRWKMLE